MNSTALRNQMLEEFAIHARRMQILRQELLSQDCRISYENLIRLADDPDIESRIGAELHQLLLKKINR